MNQYLEVNMDNITILIAITSLLLLFTGNINPVDSGSGMSAEERAVFEKVMSRENEAMEAWRQGNPMKWADISAKNVVYIDPDITKPMVGLEAYMEYLKPFTGKVHYDGSEFRNAKIQVHGTNAVLTYNYRSTKKKEDGTVTASTDWNTTEVYSLIEGEWKIIHTHWGYLGQKLPEALEMPIAVQVKEQKYEGVAAELLALESAAMERWRKGDPDGFIEISAPEVTYFDTGTSARIDGLEALKTEYDKRKGKIHYDVMEFLNSIVQVHGDTAVLFYNFFSTRLNPDGTIKTRTPWNCTEVFTKINGEWKIIHTHWSFINGQRNESYPRAD
jgi:ketosteroid isomerase-like protein